MSNSCRRSLLVLLFALIVVASGAHAGECSTDCNPYLSYCNQSCDRCIQYGFDGCVQWVPSTCGDEWGACLEDNCAPNWVETSRITQGTYDGRSLRRCNHHVVQKVTLTDYNQCNRNPSFYSYWYCDDVIDDWKNGCCYLSCCEGIGENGTQLECNGVHSCS